MLFDFIGGNVSLNILSGVEPKVNMPLEILDEGIWNYGRVIAIVPKTKLSSGLATCRVTVRCEGWNGSDWDRTMDYPDGRLARAFTYTKRVRGMVELIPPAGVVTAAVTTGTAGPADLSSTTDWTRMWPCRVYFRMPHPGSDAAVGLLESEDSILVEPYLPELLPVRAREKVSGGYLWVNGGALRPWKRLDVTGPRSISDGEIVVAEQTARLDQAPDKEYRVKLNFCRAYQQAESDWIQPMPSDPLSVGSLVRPRYRVQNVGGDVVDGVRFSGSFPSQENSRSAQSRTLPKIDIEPRARRLEHSGRFASILRTGASEIVLGTYSTEKEAVDAATAALSCGDPGVGGEGETNVRSFSLTELLSTRRGTSFAVSSLKNGIRKEAKRKRKGTPRRRRLDESKEVRISLS